MNSRFQNVKNTPFVFLFLLLALCLLRKALMCPFRSTKVVIIKSVCFTNYPC
uniref:Uncharacterized protein n=1 Tax=Arundo donax TaxID=35708 RepID=A0A0A9BKG2_ARUDO